MNNFKRLIRGKEQGFSLIEIMLSIVLIGLVGVAIFSTLSTTFKALSLTDIRETAKNIAETQMEYIKGVDFIPFTTSYPADPNTTIPSNYHVVITSEAVTDRDGSIQKITVTVTTTTQPIVSYVLENFKVNTALLGQ